MWERTDRSGKVIDDGFIEAHEQAGKRENL